MRLILKNKLEVDYLWLKKKSLIFPNQSSPSIYGTKSKKQSNNPAGLPGIADGID